MTPHPDESARGRFSPLKFERAYQEYRSRAAETPFADTRLLLAARFWSQHTEALDNPVGLSYRFQDIPPLLAVLKEDRTGTSLDDLWPDEIEEIAAWLDLLQTDSDLDDAGPDVAVRARESAARSWLYLGNIKAALKALAKSGLSDVPGSDTAEEIAATIGDIDTADIPQVLADRLRPAHLATAEWLEQFGVKWAAQSEIGHPDIANCVVVEYNAQGQPVRGRLRTLKGSVELLKPDAGNNDQPDADEVVFDHQVRASDDPQIATVYAALAALRRIIAPSAGEKQILRRSAPQDDSGGQESQDQNLKPQHHSTTQRHSAPPCHSEPQRHSAPECHSEPQRHSAPACHSESQRHSTPPCHSERSEESAFPPTTHNRRNNRTPSLRGRFALGRSTGVTHTGDSIGLAAFAVAYGHWWASDVHRNRRLIGTTTAFTGALDHEGRTRDVSNHSLDAKVKRVFCSPIQHLAVPESNRREAEETAATLRAKHPHRRLHIIGIERATDIIADHNILRTERVCIGEFAARTAAKWTRSVKVQVPILLMLLYAMVCVIEPRAWPWFDWNPESVELTTTGFNVLNSEGQKVWGKTFASTCDTSLSKFHVGDLNGDQRNEVAYLPAALGSGLSDLNARLFVYRSNGQELFSQSCVITGEYPGDTSLEQFYAPGDIMFVATRNGTRIMSYVTRSSPGRGHITFWDTTGSLQGWFINAGFPSRRFSPIVTPDSSGICFIGYNNRMECVALFALSLDTSFGVSPPYDDEEYDLSRIQRGNQLAYVLLPRTDLNRASQLPYNHPHDFVAAIDGQINVQTSEINTRVSGVSGVHYSLSSEFRVQDVFLDDVYMSTRSEFASRGILPQIVDWASYTSELRDSVKYWTPSGWLPEGKVEVPSPSK